LNNAEELKDVQALGLPITLKGMTEKKETTLIVPKPIMELTDELLQNNSHEEDNKPDEKN